MKELDELAAWLENSNMLSLKKNGNVLECQFVRGGIVCHVLQVRCSILAAALEQESVLCILEGARFSAFRHNFGSFLLRVKARQLYVSLSEQQPELVFEVQQMAVA